MGIIKRLKKYVKNNRLLFCTYMLFRYLIPAKLFGEKRDVSFTKRKFKRVFHRKINLQNPKTLNEKIQWLKLYVHEDFHTIVSDKLAARDFWVKYGEEGLIPLWYKTDNWRDITMDILPDEPFIIKCNSGSACYQIIRNKKDVDIKKLRDKCRSWLFCNHYYVTQEWQYKNIKSCIIIEKLLLDKKGHIPNDYKLHFFNGNLTFVYCSIDREGENYRSIYDPEWNRLNVEWVAPKDHKGFYGANIEKPATFDEMVRIGSDIAKPFCYVRVDFYDVDGKLYYGEITLHHGSGFDTFEPEEYDYKWGKLLDITQGK